MLIDEASYIEHYGTRGMRWGVRKEVNRQHRALPLKDKVKSAFPSARAVVEARKSHNDRVVKLSELQKKYKTTPDDKDAMRAVSEIHRIINDKKMISDIRIGASVTRGKQAAALMLVTPVVALPAITAQRIRNTNRMTDQVTRAIEER